MGMAASQVRLLQMTARKSAISYDLSHLSNQKRLLSLDMQKAAREYSDAMDSKVLKWSANAGATYTDLSYANMMYPSAISSNSPTLVSDMSGRIVLNSKYNKIIQDVVANEGTFDLDVYENNRAEILSEVTGISADKINSYEAKAVDSVYLNTYYQTLLNAEPQAPTVESSLEKFILNNECGQGLIPSYGGANVVGNSSDFENSPQYGTYKWSDSDKVWEHSIAAMWESNGESVSWSARFADTGDYKTIFQNLMIGNSEDESDDGIMTDKETKSYYALFKDYIPEENRKAFYEACKSMIEQLAQEATDGSNLDVAKGDLVGKGGEGAAAGLYYNLKNLLTQIFAAYNVNIGNDQDADIEFIDKTSEDYTQYASKGKYKIKISEKDWEACEALQDALKDTALKTGTYVATGSDFDSVHADWEKIVEALKSAIDQNDSDKGKIFNGEEQKQIDYYDALFSAIAENGYTYNPNVDDSTYLNEMLQNNLYTVTTVTAVRDVEIGLSDGDYSGDDNNIVWNNTYQHDLASNFSNIYSVRDTEAIEAAETEYEYKKCIINNKESVIDTRMNDLQTEQSAISNMIKGIESVRNDNTERNFSIMS